MTLEKSDHEVVAGNVYDKYNTANPVYRYLVNGYFNNLTSLFNRVKPQRVLEVGCGEGHMTDFGRKRLPGSWISGLDISHRIVADASHAYPQISFVCASAYDLPFEDGQFDLVLALEALEHMEDAERAVVEMCRVADPYVIASVPQEPVWRVLNFLRGAYVSDWGNTPGHVRHWSRRGFMSLLESNFEIEEVLSPFPWTMALCRRT